MRTRHGTALTTVVALALSTVLWSCSSGHGSGASGVTPGASTGASAASLPTTTTPASASGSMASSATAPASTAPATRTRGATPAGTAVSGLSASSPAPTSSTTPTSTTSTPTTSTPTNPSPSPSPPPLTATGPALSGAIPFTYTLADPSAKPTDMVAEYTLDGANWFVCTNGPGGDGCSQLATSAAGVFHTYVWDSVHDLGSVQAAVIVAICPTKQPASLSPAFLVDNTAYASAIRDWNQAPAIVQVSGVSTVYAVGDAHGDYVTLVNLLAATHVIAGAPSQASAAKWSAGNAVLVCTGDMIDKYTDSLDVIALFRALETSAAAAGGRVIVLMGNHEAEFLAGGSAPKAVDFEAELTAAGISPTDVAAGTDSLGIGAWLRALPIAAKVDDWFFCHAGNTGGVTLDTLTSTIMNDVNAHGFSANSLIGADSLLEARMHPSPWWEGIATPAKGQKQAAADTAQLAGTVAALGANHLVMGHQPGAVTFSDKSQRAQDSMFQNFGGLIFLIDTGMSRGVDSALGGVLEVTGAGSAQPVATALMADGTSTVLLH